MNNKLISMDFFPLSKRDFKEFLNISYIDMLVINKNQYILNEGYLEYLNNSNKFTKVENNPEHDFIIYVKRDFLFKK